MDTYDRIEQLMQKHNIKPYTLSKETGISSGLLSQWKKRLQQPSLEKLQLIADHFGVSVDSLLGKNGQKDDDMLVALSSPAGYDQLTDEEKQEIDEIVQIYLRRKKEPGDPK